MFMMFLATVALLFISAGFIANRIGKYLEEYDERGKD